MTREELLAACVAYFEGATALQADHTMRLIADQYNLHFLGLLPKKRKERTE